MHHIQPKNLKHKLNLFTIISSVAFLQICVYSISVSLLSVWMYATVTCNLLEGGMKSFANGPFKSSHNKHAQNKWNGAYII